jgi:hypothetical protein
MITDTSPLLCTTSLYIAGSTAAHGNGMPTLHRKAETQADTLNNMESAKQGKARTRPAKLSKIKSAKQGKVDTRPAKLSNRTSSAIKRKTETRPAKLSKIKASIKRKMPTAVVAPNERKAKYVAI